MTNENNQKSQKEQEYITVVDPKTGETVRYPKDKVTNVSPGESNLAKPWEKPQSFGRKRR